MAPDVFARPATASRACALLVLAGLLQACAARAPAPPPAAPTATQIVLPAPRPSEPATVNAPPAAAPAPAPAPSPAPPTVVQGDVAGLLAYADRLRQLPPAELTLEINRLGDGNASPPRQMQLALALLQTQQPADGQRAQALLQRVLAAGTPEALALHPLARLMAGQQAALRRLEDQLERQGQQLRDSQRRLDQLTDRLDALRAIERSLPSRPTR